MQLQKWINAISVANLFWFRICLVRFCYWNLHKAMNFVDNFASVESLFRWTMKFLWQNNKVMSLKMSKTNKRKKYFSFGWLFVQYFFKRFCVYRTDNREIENKRRTRNLEKRWKKDRQKNRMKQIFENSEDKRACDKCVLGLFLNRRWHRDNANHYSQSVEHKLPSARTQSNCVKIDDDLFIDCDG